MTIHKNWKLMRREIRAYRWDERGQNWIRFKASSPEALTAHLENLRDVILPRLAMPSAAEGTPGYRWQDDLERVTRFLAGESVAFNHRGLRYLWHVIESSAVEGRAA